MLWAARREQMSDTLGGMWASAVVVLQNGMQWNECPFWPPACLLFTHDCGSFVQNRRCGLLHMLIFQNRRSTAVLRLPTPFSRSLWPNIVPLAI